MVCAPERAGRYKFGNKFPNTDCYTRRECARYKYRKVLWGNGCFPTALFYRREKYGAGALLLLMGQQMFFVIPQNGDIIAEYGKSLGLYLFQLLFQQIRLIF